jgi:phosphopantothenoylcysteine decarboxylase/phosphopantothenate--cysteine ligase
MRYLVTAGPTREPLDPVRFLSNRSSGRMGYAIAAAALAAGHAVTLISGPVALRAPRGARIVRVTTAREMFDAVHAHLAEADVAVLAAAVADYAPARVAPLKIKKRAGRMRLELVRTPDILASISRGPRACVVAGFAAETNDLEKNARAKLARKKCDVICANDVSGDAGFDRDDNALTLFFRGGESLALPHESKRKLASRLISIFDGLKENRKNY